MMAHYLKKKMENKIYTMKNTRVLAQVQHFFMFTNQYNIVQNNVAICNCIDPPHP